MINNLKYLVNDLSNLTVALLVLIALVSIFVFVKVFKSDFSELD